jgi:ATP-dependent RNA helicase DDX19/DBP5
MVSEGHTVASLTAGVEGSLRDKVIDEFREGKAKVLVTTNVLARGIDVSTVSMVINYVRSFRVSALAIMRMRGQMYIKY